MSSYSQIPKPTTIGEAIENAGHELAALWDEMATLCANIAGQFPDTFEKIPKYQEALTAHDALCVATNLLEEVDLVHEYKSTTIQVTVGKQTRRNRPTSQRVRLANAVVRLNEAADALRLYDSLQAAEETLLLQEIIDSVAGVTFPTTFG